MISNFLRNQNLWHLSLVFLLPLLIFGFLARHQTIADPDGFYHAKISQLYSEGQWIDKLDSLPLTVLGQNYTDHHFLYHVLTAPLVWLFDPLVAVKTIGVIAAVGVFVAWYFVARNLKIKGAVWWTMLNLTSALFVFRLAMIKAVPLALILYLVALLALYQYRYFSVGVLSFVFVWTYGGWPLLPITALIFLAAHLKQKEQFKVAAKTMFASWLGAIGGLVINPFFPQNLAFYKAQIIDIAAVPMSSLLQGQEWSPLPATDMLYSLAPIWFLAILTGVLFAIIYSSRHSAPVVKHQTFGLTLITVSLILFVFTMLSRRYVEFFSPVFVLTVAWWLTQAINFKPGQNLLRAINDAVRIYKPWFIVLLLVVSLSVMSQYLRIDHKLKQAIAFENRLGVSEWLRTNYDVETVVLNVDWSYYPVLFYHDAGTKFAFGLDPRLVSESYYLTAWQDIYEMRDDNARDTIEQVFKSDLVLVKQDRADQIEYFTQRGFSSVYEDREVVVLK